MSKKATSTKKSEVPSIYAGLLQDTKLTKQCLVIDVHEQMFRFNTPQENHILKEAVQKLYPTFDGFADENKNTILARHEQMFKAEPPKEQDLTQTALMTWYAMMGKAQDRTVKPGSEGKVQDPVTGRKSSIGTRKYFRNLDEAGKPVQCHLKTPQANACLKILEESIESMGELTKINDANGKEVEVKAITEAKLKEAVIERQAELKTRQDPWRIFQYYRPQLITAKCIRHD